MFLRTAIGRLTIGPVRAFGLDRREGLTGLGTLSVGAPADLVLFDPVATWTVTAAALVSKGKNTPLLGAELRGRVVCTVAGGRTYPPGPLP